MVGSIYYLRDALQVGRQLFAQGRAGVEQARFHRAQRAADNRGDLIVRKPFDVIEQHDRAQLFGELLESLIQTRAQLLVEQEPLRVEGAIRDVALSLLCALCLLRERSRQAANLLLFPTVIYTEVRGDAKQPGIQAGAAFE